MFTDSLTKDSDSKQKRELIQEIEIYDFHSDQW